MGIERALIRSGLVKAFPQFTIFVFWSCMPNWILASATYHTKLMPQRTNDEPLEGEPCADAAEGTAAQSPLCRARETVLA